MGMFKKPSVSLYSRYSAACVPIAIPEGSPNPKNYRVVKSQTVGHHLVVVLKYPDCKNYEGKKILLYRNMALDSLLSQEEIDPHFSNTAKYLSPFARFEPTTDGWAAAIQLAGSLK